jgi:3-oxoadipate enol-lactonase
MWDGIVPALAERYRVIRYDTRGFGRTTTENVAFSDRADLAAVLDHLGEASTYLLGISRGGAIALDSTIERPERVDALVIVAGGLGGWDGPSTDDERATFEEMERRFEAKDFKRLVEAETALWVDGPGQSPDRAPATVRRQVHDWIAESYRDHTEETQPQILDPPAVGRLGEVKVPTLVIVGDVDTTGTVAACRKIADEIAGARLEVFRGIAHMLPMEEPERFTGLVLEFLADVDARRATAVGA